ncbi:MAG: hypothetical protein AAF703_18325 [Cyanobacteria bacterium P01_D01_bin.105]
MPKGVPAKLKKVSVKLPFGIGGAEWEADITERKAAWSLYIELITRIAVQDLAQHYGLLRESLDSLYSLFGITRQILKEAGPEVGVSSKSVGGIAIAVLNRGLRPFLARWHPELQAWEAERPDNVSPKEHEKKWVEEPCLRNELQVLNEALEQYALALAEIADVKS